MAYKRIIARLDVKAPYLIKGIHLEGLRKLGDPNNFAQKYYEEGVDELLYMDIVASLYGRNNLRDIISNAAKNIFIPMTVGGGIRSIEDVRDILRAGADKVALNTAATKDPTLITKIANTFGSQCVVLSIEAKRSAEFGWEAFTDNGREHTGRNAIEWAKYAESLGAGEILMTSVDKEGTGKGFDLELMKTVSEEVQIPVVASGGMGELVHFSGILSETDVSAVAMANVLHYNKISLKEIRDYANENKLNVRP